MVEGSKHNSAKIDRMDAEFKQSETAREAGVALVARELLGSHPDVF